MSGTKSIVALVVLCIVFIVGVVVGVRLLTAPLPRLDVASETSEATCKDITLRPGSKLSREHITLDVYNAGSVSGFASQTQRRLSRFGYQRGAIGNSDDLGVKALNVTVVSPKPKGPMAKLVRDQFKGNVRVLKGESSGQGHIAVVVGERFKGIDRKSRATVPVREKLEVCVPIESDPTGSNSA